MVEVRFKKKMEIIDVLITAIALAFFCGDHALWGVAFRAERNMA